jgi:hypothetical protein
MWLLTCSHTVSGKVGPGSVTSMETQEDHGDRLAEVLEDKNMEVCTILLNILYLL